MQWYVHSTCQLHIVQLWGCPECAVGSKESLDMYSQWNLSIKDTLNKGHLCNEDTVCSPNHIGLCINLHLGTPLYTGQLAGGPNVVLNREVPLYSTVAFSWTDTNDVHTYDWELFVNTTTQLMWWLRCLAEISNCELWTSVYTQQSGGFSAGSGIVRIIALKKASASDWSVGKIANSRKLVSREPPFPFKATLSMSLPSLPTYKCVQCCIRILGWGLGRWGSGVVHGWPHLQLTHTYL